MSIVQAIQPLGFPWQAADPFLFCVHHNDAYPKGNERLGPAASLEGRRLGNDFVLKDGWRMYHGLTVPGFPQHPHRGFETVTILRRGFVDHSDSLGATARFGPGDVQWLTAGHGIVHAEMFPLLDPSGPNPLELFQIWLNLPGEDKLVPPHFAMLWSRDVAQGAFCDDAGRRTEVTIIAGELGGRRSPPPPPRSWAARPDTDVAIWCIRMDPAARWTLPRAAHPATVRRVFFFRGERVRVAGEPVAAHSAVTVRCDVDVELEAEDGECEMLVLQGRPIGQPVVSHGPFVMNSRAEIERAILDYQRTGFGGWPWGSDDPVHGATEGRFAKHADGRVERPDAGGVTPANHLATISVPIP